MRGTALAQMVDNLDLLASCGRTTQLPDILPVHDGEVADKGASRPAVLKRFGLTIVQRLRMSTSCDCPKRQAQLVVFTRLTNL